MSKRITNKQLEASIAEVRSMLRETGAFDRFGMIREERREEFNAMLAMEAELMERQRAAQARAFKARQVAWNNRYGTR